MSGQHVAKAKFQRAKELRREMTPAEKILWEELPPSGTFGGRIRCFEKSQGDHSPRVVIREETEWSVLVGKKVVVILACLLAEVEEKILAVCVWEAAAKDFDQGKEDFSTVVHGARFDYRGS